MGKQSTLNNQPIQTGGVLKLSDAEMMSTCPNMFQEDALVKFDAMRDAVRYSQYSADCYAYVSCCC